MARENTMRDRLMDAVFTALVAGAVALAAASGFSSPKETLQDHESRIRKLEELPGVVGKMDQKLDDLVNGLGVPRRHPGAYR